MQKANSVKTIIVPVPTTDHFSHKEIQHPDLLKPLDHASRVETSDAFTIG